jgi:MFS family permease
MELIVMRIVKGIGGALLMANSTAIVTDAFPVHERGMAMGISNVAWVAGTFVSLVAGLYMLPLTAGFFLAGPISGRLSDRYGARRFATAGMVLAAATFAALMAVPVDFAYPVFSGLLLANGTGGGVTEGTSPPGDGLTRAVSKEGPALHIERRARHALLTRF